MSKKTNVKFFDSLWVNTFKKQVFELPIERDRFEFIIKYGKNGEKPIKDIRKNISLVYNICDENISGYFRDLLGIDREEDSLLSEKEIKMYKPNIDYLFVYDRLLNKYCGVLVVDNTECNKPTMYLKSMWVLSLICSQCGKLENTMPLTRSTKRQLMFILDALKAEKLKPISMGKVLMGLYMVGLKINKQKFGILELGRSIGIKDRKLTTYTSSYNNTGPFCVYNKFGFVPVQGLNSKFITEDYNICSFNEGNIAMISLVNLSVEDYINLSKGKSLVTDKFYPRLPLCDIGRFKAEPLNELIKYQKKIVKLLDSDFILKMYNANILQRPFRNDEYFSILNEADDLEKYIKFLGKIDYDNSTASKLQLHSGITLKKPRLGFDSLFKTFETSKKRPREDEYSKKEPTKKKKKKDGSKQRSIRRSRRKSKR